MKNVMRLFLAILICVSLVPLALATTCGGFDSTLNSSDFNGTITTGNFGDVCVVLNTSTTATITFTAASGYSFIDGNIVDVNLNVANAAALTETFVSDTTSSTPTPHEFPASGVNGYGSFNLQWDNGAASDLEQSFVFTVTTTGTWASAADVLTFNSLGFDAAAHVIGGVCPAGGTCFVAEGTGTPVPEPRFYGLVLTGLMALVGKTFFRRRAI